MGKRLVKKLIACTLVLSILFTSKGIHNLLSSAQVFANGNVPRLEPNVGSPSDIKEVQNAWYFFANNGIMLVNTFTPDGYMVGIDGKWFR